MWRRDFVGLRILMIEFMVADRLLINNIDKRYDLKLDHWESDNLAHIYKCQVAR